MRVAIVNDLAMATETLRRLLLEMPGIQVAWTALDGREAVEKARQDRPDLILMDMVMPVMDGPEATRRIMKDSPCAIVVVTATVGGNAERVYEALSAGALDATETPAAGPDWGKAREMLARKIEQVRRLRGASMTGGPCDPHAGSSGAVAPPARPAPAPPPPSVPPSAPSAPAPRVAEPARTPSTAPPVAPTPSTPASFPRIVAIGSSTGGPAALAAILAALPADFPFAIVVVQHLDRAFVPGLVTWLSRETGRQVEIAAGGALPRAGVCSVAGEDLHLTLGPTGVFVHAREPRDSIHRPSVDVLFRGLTASRIEPFAAVLLTGMGRDGAEGLLELRRAGWTTIAQDRTTSVVWGMPGAADRLGAAVEVLPLPMIAPELLRLASSSRSRI